MVRILEASPVLAHIKGGHDYHTLCDPEKLTVLYGLQLYRADVTPSNMLGMFKSICQA